MSETLTRPEAPSDGELISAVRNGDVEAYGTLFARHVDAARRLARQLASPGDADDLVSDAFARVLGVLQRGGGPDLAFRAYLLTALRRLHVDRIRSTSRLHTTDDLEPFDPGVPFRDTAVEGFESTATARAFASLPERWQVVLWHTEVEGQKPAEVATVLGMSPNSVSALAYRAREGLRQAYLTMHAGGLDEDTCRWTRQHLGSHVRKGLARRDATRIEEHLRDCPRCLAAHLELTEVNSNLAALIGPVVLGGVAAGYLGTSAGAAAVPGALLMLLDRAKDFVIAHAQASAVAGVAATTVVAGGTVVTLPDREVEARTARPTAVVVTDRLPVPGTGSSGPRADQAPRRARPDDARHQARHRRGTRDAATPIAPGPSDFPREPAETAGTPEPTGLTGPFPTDVPDPEQPPAETAGPSPGEDPTALTDSPPPTPVEEPSPEPSPAPTPAPATSEAPPATEAEVSGGADIELRD